MPQHAPANAIFRSTLTNPLRASVKRQNYNSCLADDNIKLLSILDRQSSRATLAPINA